MPTSPGDADIGVRHRRVPGLELSSAAPKFPLLIQEIETALLPVRLVKEMPQVLDKRRQHHLYLGCQCLLQRNHLIAKIVAECRSG
jgi:hypothetical protein